MKMAYKVVPRPPEIIHATSLSETSREPDYVSCRSFDIDCAAFTHDMRTSNQMQRLVRRHVGALQVLHHHTLGIVIRPVDGYRRAHHSLECIRLAIEHWNDYVFQLVIE